MTTLVYVDCQYKFDATRKASFQDACVREANRLLLDTGNPAVIFVEYINFGPTLSIIKDKFDHLERSFTVRKSFQDGSYHIHQLINAFNLPRTIRICGVNTEMCVASTVRGLHARLYNNVDIEVIPDAVNSISESGHKYGLWELRSYIKK